MKVTVAMDSFKGSLSSREAGEAVAVGIRRVYPAAKVQICPLADGGEGTSAALVSGMGGEWVSLTTTGPLGEPVKCRYGIVRESKTAIMEMSSVAGLTLVPEDRRNPLYTTTFGLGEMILHAIKEGCRNFIIGIGGSATNDGGIGMLQALGYEFLDKDGMPVPFGARGLFDLAEIRKGQVIPELGKCFFRVACDVENGLCGPKGSSVVFGPQKGATPEMVAQMDEGLARYAKLAKTIFPKADPGQKGAGAAGGLGFAFLTFTNAVLESGIDIVLRETGFERYLADCDFVVTGEGRMDGQTAMGKAPLGVAKLAKKYGKPVLAFAGSVTGDARACNEMGVDAFFPIVRGPISLAEAMEPEQAAENLSDAVEQVFRLIEVMA